MKKELILWLCLVVFSMPEVYAQNFITTANESRAFPVVSANGRAVVCVDSNDYFLVNKAASLLRQDIKKVTGQELAVSSVISGKNIIVIGSIQKSSLIKKLVAEQRIDTNDLSGKWESYKIHVVDQPFKGVNKALVIAGSDRRGTAYGVFTLSRQMGVSPWYWWADVPVKKKKVVFVKKGTYFYGPPAVKYRGIFINDEAPSLSGWVHEKYGDSTGSSQDGFNHHFYRHVFELLLRLRANYLWPAMWGRSFNVDDTLNPVLADKYGIVMGTAHNEPMMRSRQEWQDFGHGPWNYQTNAAVLDSFWRDGIKRMEARESIVTIGMRGNGDKPMSDKTNIALLEKIVKKQRKIIAEVTGKPASATPQDWALYKEVLDYYDKGMRVPGDVTLIYCDDNWGNMRRLPALKDSSRPGGFGLYYHFDYVGGPRNYKWINTSQISRVWEQLHLAYKYHVRNIWVVNVGDIKPMEFPISFFMDYAWNADKWKAKDMAAYTETWVKEQFGGRYSNEITGLIKKYTRYNSRRKPELLSPDTYSLSHYREAERIVRDYNRLAEEGEKIYHAMPRAYQPAFYQLVLYPVAASANLNNLYVTAAQNGLYAKQGRAMTNQWADSVKALFIKDSLLSYFYNKKMKNGRWDHMMDQTHIGYTYWQQPRYNNMPRVQYITIPNEAKMGVAIQGSGKWWPHDTTVATLPVFDAYNPKKYFIDIFNRGKKAFHYKISANQNWIQINTPSGEIDKQKRIWISINRAKAPQGTSNAFLTITGPHQEKVKIKAVLHNPRFTEGKPVHSFIESNGFVSMEAAHFTKAVNKGDTHWVVIPNLGRTLSGVTAFPVTTSDSLGDIIPRLEYNMYLFDTGTVKVQVYLSPTLNFDHSPHGLRFAVSLDQKAPKVVNMLTHQSSKMWAKHVSNNINIQTVSLSVAKAGKHVLKLWRIDPGVVFQKIVVDAGGEKSSYLGPPESYYMK